ncbi:MAG: hypothetical protein IT379_36790 [Deltaproteobacteria bacterium]|nr:hypothetical protein [Deltaproteobacteria bacterium]
MRASIATGATPLDLESVLRRRGVDASVLVPPSPLVLAWRLARKAARSSVPAKMVARAGFERAWGLHAASRILSEQPDLVIADLATARALEGRRTVDVLVLTRGTTDALHDALDAEAERSPELRAHLTNFRASSDERATERRLVASAGRVLASSRWIGDSASAAGARDVRIVPPALREEGGAARASCGPGPLRVLVAGVLIGRHGARPMLDAARALGRAVEVTFAGRIADDRAAIARWAGHFRLANAPTFERALDDADVLVAPWIIDGRSREVDVALSRGVPVVGTSAAGVDADTHGALRVDAGSGAALVDALGALASGDVRAHLASETARSRASRSDAATLARTTAALFD